MAGCCHPEKGHCSRLPGRRAVSPETAKTCREAGVVEGLGVKLGQLVRRGVLVSCGGGRYYVDVSKSDQR